MCPGAGGSARRVPGGGLLRFVGIVLLACVADDGVWENLG